MDTNKYTISRSDSRFTNLSIIINKIFKPFQVQI
jgi:hypothetical protein